MVLRRPKNISITTTRLKTYICMSTLGRCIFVFLNSKKPHQLRELVPSVSYRKRNNNK